MNSFQLDSVLGRLLQRRNFKGVFSSNNLVKFDTYPHSFVANTQRMGSSGEHWIAFYSPNSLTIEIFDSLGEPLIEDFRKFAEMNYKNIIHNINQPLQSIFSDSCGQFCIFFLVHRHARYSFKKVVGILKTKDDKYVKIFLNKLLK